MPATMRQSLASSHPVIPEMRPRMAKADLRKPETDEWRCLVGRAISRCMALRGLTLKEFAAAVERDERQCAKWISGQERAQFDAIMAVDSLRQPMAQAFCELAGADIEVTVRLRVSA